MAYRKKTWREKLADKPDWPKFLKLEKRFPCYNAVRKMGAQAGDDIVLANPSVVLRCMARVPRGRLTTITEICRTIAGKYRVKGCCTLTTGIFIALAANAVEESKKEKGGLKLPYWRTLKADGSLNEKYPGGVEGHEKLLAGEGFRVARKGQKRRVENYQDYLFKLRLD